MIRLKDKVAIITGAGSGIGRALAGAFAAEGAALVLNDLPSCSTIAELVESIRAAGGRAVACPANVGRLDEHERLILAALDNFHRLDILVNNAAIDRRAPFLEVTPEQWDEVMAVDLKGPYFLAQKAARAMAATGGGAILNISSVHDERPHRNNSIYTIAKGGLKLMTRCLALELAPLGIRVNALSPGAILTEMNRRVLSDPEYRQKVLQQIPLGRVGDACELTAAAVLLVSDGASYITGATLYVDGGMML